MTTYDFVFHKLRNVFIVSIIHYYGKYVGEVNQCPNITGQPQRSYPQPAARESQVRQSQIMLTRPPVHRHPKTFTQRYVLDWLQSNKFHCH